MAKMIWAANETNSQNSDGSCLAMYFDGMPTEQEVKDALTSGVRPRYEKATKMGGPATANFGGGESAPLWSDPNDEFFDVLVVETPVSKAANLVRVEVMAC